MLPRSDTIRPEAADEARSAYEWYGEQNVESAADFEEAVDRAVAQIADGPRRWPSHAFGTRRYVMRRFPYLIIYRDRGFDVEILAFAHAKRRHGYWRDRLRG